MVGAQGGGPPPNPHQRASLSQREGALSVQEQEQPNFLRQGRHVRGCCSPVLKRAGNGAGTGDQAAKWEDLDDVGQLNIGSCALSVQEQPTRLGF